MRLVTRAAVLMIAGAILLGIGQAWPDGPTWRDAVRAQREPVLCGDADSNGVVNPVDAAVVLQMAAGIIETTPSKRNADVNRDVALSPLDALLILQYTAALIEQPTCAPKEFSTDNVVVTITSQGGSSGPDAIVSIANDSFASFGPEDFTIEIEISNAMSVGAFEILLSYDESLIEYIGSGESDFLQASPRGSGAFCSSMLLEAGLGITCTTLGPPVCLGGPEGADGDGTLMRVAFRPLRPGAGPLNFTNVQLVGDDVMDPCDPQGELLPVIPPVTSVDAAIEVSVGSQ